MNNYIRKVQYHETDKMGIAHHSNYIKWMEEARIDFLEQMGYGYAKLEADGIISPVIAVECEYKRPSYFGDELEIKVEIDEFERVKLVLRYTVTNRKTGELIASARSSHCFLSPKGMPISLKRQFPELDAALKALVTNE